MNNETTNANMTLPTEITRLNRQERVQHFLTFATFVILVATGYMLRIPEDWISKFGEAGRTIFYYRSLIHRIAGVAMIITGLYHVIYLGVSRDGRSFIKDMIPNLRDAIGGIQNLAYYLGLRSEPPKFDRFDYREKAEYWALVAGTIIISVTGIFLWTETYWSKFILDLSILIHGMEAILATLAIIVWHFYAVHWKPGQFPMSNVWIDGKMSAHHLKEEHPLQYERLVAEGKLAPVEEGHDVQHHHLAPRKDAYRRLMEVVSLGSIFFFAGVSFLLVKILYFPPSFQGQAMASKSSEFESLVKKKETTETMHHFHNTDDTSKLVIANPPICVKCHGTYPHGKAPDIRSFLNMHNYFMACETCHVRREDVTGTVEYKWFDYQTEELVEKIEGDNGVYGARLVPVLFASMNESRRLDQSADEEFAKQYMAQKDTLTPEEQAKAKVVLHKGISKKPLQCTECHSKKAYIDLATVGYAPARAESLYRTEVADMINRYMNFYLPTMFDPDLMKKEKLKKLESEDRSPD